MNEQLEIQKLKQERAEILAKVEELDRLTACAEGVNWPEVSRVIDSLKALRPKPERLRGWANVYPPKISEIGFLYDSEETAKKLVRASGQVLRTAVPMIEVRPLPELPEMKEWTADNSSIYCDDGPRLAWADTSGNARMIIERHNATVRAFKKWAEDAKKEVGDE